MYGLRQAAIYAYKYLQTTLQPFGYFPILGTVGMWKHHTRPIHFCLCIDDFGIKYFNKTDLNHLINALKSAYEITDDLSGSKFCGLTLDWNYEQGHVDISMPNYVVSALEKLNHPTPTKTQDAPHPWIPKQYGKQSHLTSPDISPFITS